VHFSKKFTGYCQADDENLNTNSIIHDFPGMYDKFYVRDGVATTGLFLLADPDTYEYIGYAIFQNGRISSADKLAVVSKTTKEHWIDGKPQDWPDGSAAVVAQVMEHGLLFEISEHWNQGRLMSINKVLITS
jgi:hypothetical protein